MSGLPPAQALDELGRPGAFIVFMQRHERPLQAQFAQKEAAVARILGGHDADACENFTRPRRNVGHVADWRRHDVKHARLRHYNAPLRPHRAAG
jgi:hypothetical protein